MRTLVQSVILSNTALLNTYLRGDWQDIHGMKELCFLRSYRLADQFPDYVHKNRLDHAFHDLERCCDPVLNALGHLADHHLSIDNSGIYIDPEALESWQILLTRFPPLPIIAYALYQLEQQGHTNIAPLIECLRNTALPCVYHPQLDEYLEGKKQLSDIHVHLNGSTESDWVWQDALKSPRLFGRVVKNSIADIAQEQFKQLDDTLKPAHLSSLLCIAAEIRRELCEIVNGQKPIKASYIYESKFSVIDYWAEQSAQWAIHPFPETISDKEKLPLEDQPKNRKKSKCRWHNPKYGIETKPARELIYEVYFLMKTFRYLRDNKKSKRTVGRLLHYYFLIQGYMNKLMVQQVNQKGFDQFQKITLNGMREFSENTNFYRRYEQMQGMDNSNLKYLEGRFAPKNNTHKLNRLLTKIMGDYKRYLKDNPENVKLRLVAHFIKKASSKYHTCQHYSLRQDLHVQARTFVRMKKYRKFRRHLVGCDAASNEMHAPPEVFAPIFRYLRSEKVSRFTYHAGEDFQHLVGGIRAVYEAITFLGLQEGNRIGHATALGITPDRWKRGMGDRIVVRRTQWLDDLVFAWSILRQEKAPNRRRLTKEIRNRAAEIYGRRISPHTLEKAWRMRHLDPCKACSGNNTDTADYDIAEWDLIEEAKKENPQAFALLLQYHEEEINNLTWGKGNGTSPYTEVEADFFSDADLKKLQLYVLKKVSQKGIALESMPTSNVRLSFYDTHSEHHIGNWIDFHNLIAKDNGSLKICLGTDDPGIFATNIKNEYAHILQQLRNPKTEQINNDCYIRDTMGRLQTDSNELLFPLEKNAN